MMEKFKKVALGFFGAVLCGQMAQAEVLYFHADHLGSMGVGTNSVSAVQQVESYTPFGETVIARDPALAGDRSNLPTHHLYTNQELDRSSDLSYYGARYYDPALARFVSTDPLIQVDSKRLNPYAYTGNNPLRNIDPTGEDFWDVVNGTQNGFAHSVSLGTISLIKNGNVDFQLGQRLGLSAAGALGVLEMFGGGSMVAGGGAFTVDTLGFGAPLATPVMIEGGALVVHGGAATARALDAARLMQSFSVDEDDPDDQSEREGKVVPAERLEKLREARISQKLQAEKFRPIELELKLEAERLAGVRARFEGVANEARKVLHPGPISGKTLAALDELQKMLPDLDEVQKATAKTYLNLTKPQ